MHFFNDFFLKNQLTELVARQVLPQHSIFPVSIENRQSGVPIFAVKIGFSPRCRTSAQVVAVSFQSEEPNRAHVPPYAFILSADSDLVRGRWINIVNVGLYYYSRYACKMRIEGH